MLVSQKELPNVADALLQAQKLSLDTECTGLWPYQGDRPFSIIICSESEVYYFNLKQYDGISEDLVLDPLQLRTQLGRVFGDPDKRWYLHNAKYDLGMLRVIGISLAGDIHCTEAIARVERNDHPTYSLDACVKRMGLKKDDKAKDYIKDHKLWEWETFRGEELASKRKFFDRIPLELISSYAETDAKITYRLGKYQEASLAAIDAGTPEGKPSILKVYENEKRLTKTCFKMEQAGIKVDLDYCERALAYEKDQYARAAREFESLTGSPFKDSPKLLTETFTRLGVGFGRTEKGNPSFDQEALEANPSPVSDIVLNYREHYKKAHTYYQNFLRFADADGIIHANIRQGGTKTGRVSYSDPNLQNQSKEEDLTPEFLIRRAFVPRPGYFFAMLDLDQAEYRMMVDYAGEAELIRKIQSGLDVHVATGQMMGVTRKQAKTINFALLYRSGAAKLALQLGTTLNNARDLKARYFQALPQVRAFIQGVQQTAALRGWVHNWYGRRYMCPDSRFAYKMPNALMQGGVGDLVKVAMNQIDDYLVGRKSRMVAQVHDEVVCEVHESEAHILPDLKAILEGVYPYKRLKLTAGLETSRKSLADREEAALLLA